MLFSLSHQHQHLNFKLYFTELPRARSLGGIEGVKLHPRAEGDPSHHFFPRNLQSQVIFQGGGGGGLKPLWPLSSLYHILMLKKFLILTHVICKRPNKKKCLIDLILYAPVNNFTVRPEFFIS